MKKPKVHLDSIFKIFQKENLISLSDNDYSYKGINVLEFSGENTNSDLKKYNSIKNVFDMVNCNNDLKFFTAQLYLYRPYINNPILENRPCDGLTMFTYFQNPYDWAYSTYVSCCYEKLYNFWDRIGDSLAYYLNLDISEDRVSFHSVIEKLSNSNLYNSNSNFEFLQKFKNNEFSEFNSHRKDIVHYYQFETDYFYNFTINSFEKEKIMKLWERKSKMPEYFKDHLIQSCDGFYHTYKLINNLP